MGKFLINVLVQALWGLLAVAGVALIFEGLARLDPTVNKAEDDKPAD